MSDLPEPRDDERTPLEDPIGGLKRRTNNKLPYLRYDARELRGDEKAQRRRSKRVNRFGTRKGRA